MKIERTLELTIKMGEDGVSVDVYEPESGECSTIEAPLSLMSTRSSTPPSATKFIRG